MHIYIHAYVNVYKIYILFIFRMYNRRFRLIPPPRPPGHANDWGGELKS